MNKRKLIFHIVLVLIPILLTMLVTSCFNKKNNTNNYASSNYSANGEYLNASNIPLSNNPVTLKCGWEVWYINNYDDLKKTKVVLLTNTKVFKDELNTQIHFQEITNPIINNINTKKFWIYADGKWLGLLGKEILEINQENISNMLYIDDKRQH